ncbi:hypothetical protein AD951_07610 [Acetobacter malorum]|uniref:Uncharacterized protein n=1 Tax=Acetobacter malorum TaxID=178901 RepID=A0A149UMN0_9PROT|nr:hypothetical protein [Acetobacter malorum]KXV69197.1 hypothetical protein AD951_07610 [Acetobacter malorum]
MFILGFLGLVFGGLFLVAAIGGGLSRFVNPNATLDEERKNNPAGYVVRRTLFPGMDARDGEYAAKAAEARAAQEAAATRATIFAAGVRAGYKF